MAGFNIVRDMVQRLNLHYEQVNGCRYFGPFKCHKHFNPPEGCEVFVGKLLPDCFEDELYTFFGTVGPVFDIRVMVNFDGNNRGFGFVRFYNTQDADRAVAELNGRLIRPNSRQPVFVAKSTDQRALVLSGLPRNVTKEEVQNVFNLKSNDQLVKVEELECSRPVFLLCFGSHRAAAVTKRSCSAEPLPPHWGTNICLMWEPNKAVEERIKYKRQKNALKRLEAMTFTAYNEYLLARGIDSAVANESSVDAAGPSNATAGLPFNLQPVEKSGITLPLNEMPGPSNVAAAAPLSVQPAEQSGMNLAFNQVGQQVPVARYQLMTSGSAHEPHSHFLLDQSFSPFNNIGGENIASSSYSFPEAGSGMASAMSALGPRPAFRVAQDWRPREPAMGPRNSLQAFNMGGLSNAISRYPRNEEAKENWSPAATSEDNSDSALLNEAVGMYMNKYNADDSDEKMDSSSSSQVGNRRVLGSADMLKKQTHMRF